MSTADVAGIAPGAIDAMRSRERALYEKKHPRSRELAAATAGHWFQGVPMHWMDWGTPFPLFVREAQGATLTGADGNRHADFCCPDTTPADVDHLVATVRDCCDELRAA